MSTDWQSSVANFLAEYEDITYRRYADALAEFAAWYQVTYNTLPEPALLTVEELREYRNHLVAQGHKAATVNLRLAPLRGLLRSIGRNVKIRGVKQVKPAIEALDGRELGRLLAAVEGPDWQDVRNGAMLNVLARAGLRLSEVLALKLDDVTLNDRSGSLLVRQGKGKKERTVALAKEARAALRAYLDVRPKMAQTEVLFISRSWQPLGPRDVQRLIAEASRRAGIQKTVTPHTLRHTFATRFLQNGGDVATLASLLGHTNVATTTRYLHPNAARVQEMVEEL
ncbi:MAG: tyrosine-type recombinase/integrase [Anaerolineae bacterium]|jgi:site-specific recombinase XerD|nr:tyrosine-type recombinase/integrase [Anaerolineae bacterium]